MGTPGSGRKRAPIKDRFSAEDEALSSIAREAEARLAAKRAARAEARDIRMRELERQQKELSYRHSSSSKKWGQIQQWMADTEKACHGNPSRSQSRRKGLEDDAVSVHSSGSYRSSASSLLGNSSFMPSSRKKSLVSDASSSRLKSSHSTSSVYNDLHRKAASSRKKPDLLTGLYYDQRKYSSLKSSKPPPPLSSTISIHQPRASSTTSTGLMRSYSAASICDAGLYGPYGSRATSEYSWCSSGASSTRSSPVSSSDDDSASTTSQDHIKRGRRDSVSSELSDMSETAADYFSRSNRRGSIVSDLDDLSIPDLDILDEKCDKQHSDSFSRPSSRCATPGLSAATLASLGGSSSRRGSGDMASIVIEPDASLSELRDIYDLKDQIQDVEGRYMQGLKELKESLSEVEEKYKKAMVSNAQLDNDKSNLIYQVDTLKDVIEELEEQMSELIRETEDKSKELERQKHTCSVLLHKQEELKEGIRQRDELIEANQNIQFKLDTLTREVFDLQETVNWKDKKIAALERQKEYFDCIRNERDELKDELADLKGKSKTVEKHGLVIIPEGTPNGDVSHESPTSVITLVTQEAAQVLESAGDGPLDIRLRKLAEEKDELLSQIRKLKTQLQEERQKHSVNKMESVYSDGERLENGTDLNVIEMQRDANRQISEYKFKLSKAEQEMGTMEQNINRLEGQVLRYKAAADNSEKIEDELKAEKRKLQRELRGALDKIEEMEMTNTHLVKRLEKMKANRNALLSQQ
ncbi:leucine-rich repeat flightless-interacting protein 2 isoform X1 [Ictalurus furcatus]|uniref:leucine-rich repeat flightless-interacting protein 2 isoform X1 n=1 Tax=Ictalurus furcatus TaxID=66913 RepID=UPI002350FEE4|nr:leucine-rich repeat flightless-interacting protein 2 isoform X1 [Ictalurus furcatus]XP_053476644.1 leucine-rich repeat flightless-interacting protein 2 isoform X1 [Ictalurus furcatus]XP_053476645.1 leucine-rich repeat flightless-interacting protein 2 isoform X1 [Ictalurus furcatus]XP_053476646.1 leucine-rich repeat flightless-interacting protein 2 isoform X1 [Ictalurus furcatus]